MVKSDNLCYYTIKFYGTVSIYKHTILKDSLSSERWMHRCSELTLQMTELQEDTGRIQLNQEKIQRQIITNIERKITELSNTNQEMEKHLSDLTRQNLEIKQTLLEVCNYSQWKKDVLSEIAKKVGVSSGTSEH